MSKQISKLVVSLVSICLFSSCAALHDFYTVPYVGLDNGNFRYERAVECSVSNAYLFGLGGLNYGNLMEELKNEANLQDGEVLVNVSVHKSTSIFLGIIIRVTYTATADVARLNP